MINETMHSRKISTGDLQNWDHFVSNIQVLPDKIQMVQMDWKKISGFPAESG